MISETFPRPEDQALAVSDALVETIDREIEANDGWLGFERYMQLALYEPGLGYYSAGAAKFGAAGDFTTAPELGDWLAACLAPFIADVLASVGSNRIVELGAGSGRLAGQLLEHLSKRGVNDTQYFIVEISADLKARQQQRLERYGDAVRWLDDLPDGGFKGLVLANEVADALPVCRFVKSGDAVLPLGVARHDGELTIAPGSSDPKLTETIAQLEQRLGKPLPDGYESEVCLLLRPWLDRVLGSIAEGGVLLIDYGMPERDYYRAERTGGTLICHYRQRAHSDPLLWPGLQDISAWVDFSAVASAADASGFSVGGFTTQGQFLLESIARDELLSSREPTPQDASAMQTLVLPGEMGERFKLMWLATASIKTPLPGRDFRNWL